MAEKNGFDNIQLAQWLQQVLATPPGQVQTQIDSLRDEGELAGNYHPQFYTQLPNFAMALLKNEPYVILRYAPLIYHLIGCRTCHTAYLEIYDAMKAAIQPDIPAIEVEEDEQMHSMVNVPVRMVELLCELLIDQAGALLRQGRHEHTDNDVRARALLQQAIYISLHIKQNNMRQHALRNLVEVASLADTTPDPIEQNPAAHSYASLVGSGNGSRNARAWRGVHTLERPDSQQVIYLQSGRLSGAITQHEDTLELHLVDLDKELRGRYITISVLLGTLLEPVRWLGGNPRAIRSQSPVAADGSLTTSLGKTELHLGKAEDRYLLETLFKKLDVRPAD
ncbi:MAG TPA: hypothetical protein VFA09_14760 [Ktedonobacteraceae bacterium]|nr:hypothetical protein [Ktedonobacteraceae bacterium]